MSQSTQEVEQELTIQEIFEDARAEGDCTLMDTMIERASRLGYERLAKELVELYPDDFSGACGTLER